jgi:hypothetical protein
MSLVKLIDTKNLKYTIKEIKKTDSNINIIEDNNIKHTDNMYIFNTILIICTTLLINKITNINK